MTQGRKISFNLTVERKYTLNVKCIVYSDYCVQNDESLRGNVQLREESESGIRK